MDYIKSLQLNHIHFDSLRSLTCDIEALLLRRKNERSRQKSDELLSKINIEVLSDETLTELQKAITEILQRNDEE